MSESTKRPLLLIAEDDEIGRLFLIETLEQAGFDTVCVADGAAALEAAVSGEFRLALLDVDMPIMNGYDVCGAIRSTSRLKYLPIVMITGHDDADSIERAYEAGATDFIAKPVNWTLLPHRLRYILRNADAEARQRYVAYYDPLTGLANSQALRGIVATAITRAEAAAGGEGVALLHLDVVGCSRIRAIFGPDEGDQALCAFAARLASCTAVFDPDGERVSIARVDGDRFVVCLRAEAIRSQAAELTQQLEAALDEPVSCGSQQFLLQPVVGVAFSPEHGRDAKVLITAAAAAKHHALQMASTTAVIYSNEMGDRARGRLALEAALRQAVRSEQLALYYQPKVRIADGSLAGVEALLRWHDPDLGDVSPDSFVPLAEESGLILEIGRWVSEAACRQLMNWRDQGFQTSIAINLSARQFVHDDPAEFIQAAARAAKVDARSIVVEITESALIRDLAGVQRGLLALRALGCRIAIDDFGTGYSSLAYLKGLPVSELKIDKSFIRNLATNHVDAAICTAILSLARDVGLNVTAEGVESPAQFEWLRRNGCGEAQGFLVARPMSAFEILARYGNPQRAAVVAR